VKTINYSAVYRIMAFLAVSSAIAAVAWAIRDPLLLGVGIPGLAAGHYYSWRRRHASIRRSLILLLFMALTAFLGGDILMTGLSDRMLLSRYLIYGLVIGSFDLMRHRNVIASLVLGGLLMVLISEFALSLWFIAFLTAFIALALSAVAVGRLEGETGQAVLVGEFRWFNATKAWLGLAAGALLVSAAVFLLMPRMASGQMAQANWLPSRLDLSLPGLATLPSQPSASVSPGIVPSSQERTFTGDYAVLGYASSAADVPVMYVRSRVSSYWRGMVLDTYDGRGWLSSSLQIDLRDPDRKEYVMPDSSAALAGRRAYWQTYYLLTDQPNAMFTGYRPGRIYLPGEGITLLESGTLYRALSIMPSLQPQMLRADQAMSDEARYLALPPISERTAALAESVVEGAVTDYDKAVRLEQFLLANYPYDLSVEPLPSERDAVDYFLFEQQAGYCSHFATAMAVMARHVGLPARVAAGYLPGYIDTLTGAHIVRTGDAHAWVEIYFQWHGWVAFDPTPRPDAAMGFIGGRNWLHFSLEDYTGVTLSSLARPLADRFSVGRLSLPRWLWLLVPATAVAVAVLVFCLRRRGRGGKRREVWHYSLLEGDSRRAMLKLYRRMAALLAKRGLPPRLPHQAPLEHAEAVFALTPAGSDDLRWLAAAASRAAYDPAPFNESMVAEAGQRLAELRRALGGARPGR